MSNHANEHKNPSNLQQPTQGAQENLIQDFPSLPEAASLYQHIERMSPKNITHRKILGLQRMVGNRATGQLLSRMRLAGKSAQIQRDWAATAISDQTIPRNNSGLKTFIEDNDLEKKGSTDKKNLEDMTNFNTLHHIIARETISKTLAPALKNGLNSQNKTIRTAATAFFDQVKEVATFHDDIMKQPNVSQEQQLNTLMQNMPLNFELGYQNPTGDPGTGFDPQVEKGETVNGITTYVMTTLSAALKELYTELETLSTNPTASKWDELTDIMTRAVYAYKGLTDKLDLLIRPNLDQWDEFNGEAQKKREGQYIDDVSEAFEHAGNSYATSDDLEDTSGIEDDWEVTFPNHTQTRSYNDPGTPDINFNGITFRVDLRHIAERHTMKFFQFNTTSANTFFPANTVQALKQTLTGIITNIFKPHIEAHIDEVDLKNNWPGFDQSGPLGGYFTLFNMSTEPVDDDSDTVFVKVTTIAPNSEAGADVIQVTQPKIQEWLTKKG